MQHKGFIKGGLITIGLAGMVFAIGDTLIPQEGDFLAAATDPDGFAKLVTSEYYGFWSARGLIGVAMENIGTLALMILLLQTRQARLAIWSTVLLFLGDLTGMSMFTLLHDVFPPMGRLMLAGTAGPDVLQAASLPPYVMMSMMVTWIGLILSALAIWRCGCLPKWSGWLVLLGFLLIPVPNMVVQVGSGLLWGGAYFWMALAMTEPAEK